jgi:hypothetical protein
MAARLVVWCQPQAPLADAYAKLVKGEDAMTADHRSLAPAGGR